MSEREPDKYVYRSPDYKEYQCIIYEPGVVTRIILNRPRYMNAIGHPTLGELGHAFERAGADPQCKVIVVSGAGSCFSAGDDTIGHTPQSAPMLADGTTPEELVRDYGSESAAWRAYNQEHEYLTHDMWEEKIRLIPKPTIAMVHSYAMFMGFGLANTMDVIFASEDALFLSGGVVWELGIRKSLEIAFEHRFLTIGECLETRLVNRVYPTFEILEKETLAYAYRVSENPLLGNWGTVTAKIRAQEMRESGGYADWNRGRRSYEERQYNQTGVPVGDRNRQRYEGRGMARAPRALANLKRKLEFEGAPVPAQVLGALAKAAARDDKAFWQKALSQDWRDKRSIENAAAHAKVYEETIRQEEAIRREEKAKRLGA
ncbi:MAG TPA: hypothetical protein DEV93_10530 [Chloroflexi bacterium]|jgi:enoyl-CoA hydratase|nr:hypothetical protein [Chloroflexota bacterium]